MSKEKILESKLFKLVSEHKDYDSVDKLKKLPEYEIMLCAMQEFADQEKEKVAVAFAEWFKSNVEYSVFGYFSEDTGDLLAKTMPDLYQYFINNVYNK